MPPRKTKEKTKHREVEDEHEHEDILVHDEPPVVNPYEILGLEENATAEQIRRAYRKQALKYHPDKATPENKDDAHTKFQELALAYAVLSDERRRKRYDLTGSTAETLEEDESGFNWTDFYRKQYSAVIDGDAIERIRREYQGSEEERGDILAAYEAHGGDMDLVFEDVMLSSVVDDEGRFREIILAAIESGEVEDYEKFSGESERKRNRRVRKAKGEEEEAREMARELGVEEKLFGKGKRRKGDEEDNSALMAVIQQRQKRREESFFADLEAKYAPKPKSKVKKTKGRA